MRPEIKLGLIGGLVLLVAGFGTYLSLKKPSEPLKNLPVTNPAATAKPPTTAAPNSGAKPANTPPRTPLDSPKPATPPSGSNAPVNTPNNAAPPPAPASRPSVPPTDSKPTGPLLSGASLNPTPGLLPQDTPATRPTTIILPEVKPAAVPGDTTLGNLKQDSAKPVDPPKTRPGGTGTNPPSTSGTEKPRVPLGGADPGANSASPVPKPTQLDNGGKYTIQPGDRLSDIARDHYGDAGLWRLIKEANPGLDENRLVVGKSIILPPKPEKHSAAKAGDTAKSAGKSGVATTKPTSMKMGSTPAPTPTNAASKPKPDSPKAPPRTDAKTTSKPASAPTKAAAKPAANEKSTSKPVGATSKNAKPASAPAGAGTHTVGSGETLRSIARKRYGSDKRWREIYDLNKDKLKSPDHLEAGMVLKLPAR